MTRIGGAARQDGVTGAVAGAGLAPREVLLQQIEALWRILLRGVCHASTTPHRPVRYVATLVGPVGLEPTTNGLKVRSSAN